jgi:predicted RNase H-like HicB family nuclease
VPGCIATGATPEDTRAQMQEAMTLHFEGLHGDGLPVPSPAAIGEIIEVGT